MPFAPITRQWDYLRPVARGWTDHPWHSPRRQGHDTQPEVANLTDDLREVFKTHRFGDVAVGMQAVSGEDVPLGLRGGQDHDRNGLQVCIGLDLREDLPAIFFGEVPIQKDEVGRNCSGGIQAIDFLRLFERQICNFRLLIVASV
jgi:hypothetical protein